MRSCLFALLLTACAATPPPVAPVSPEPPAPPAAPPLCGTVTALPSMLPPGESALPAMAPLAAPTAPAPVVLPAAAQRQGGLEHGMRNCPTSVPGAITRATNTPFGVDLTITAPEPASQRRIIELSAIHETMGDPDGSAMRHTGLHGGPGSIGYCPIVHDATTVTFTRLRKGAVIHLRALLPSDVARVQAIVAERLAYLAEH